LGVAPVILSRHEFVGALLFELTTLFGGEAWPKHFRKPENRQK
jgi:hypothetical protein